MTSVEDALNNVTEFDYDVNGNMTKVTDALDRETDYEYDAMNRLVKIVSPSGSQNEMTFTYNILGQLVSQTDFDGKTVTYAYDHMGRVVTTTDAEGDTDVAYNSDGTLASVTDGLNHTTSYAYDTAFRLTTVTDPISKVVKYFYDSAGRMSKVGAGATGAVDPTEYFYSSTTGLLETVRYTSGGNTYDADYHYDDAARLAKLTDWIDAVDGLQYEYDDAGRLVTLRDYDGEELTYVYDAAGNITSMTDYHGNTTAYTYTDLNQVNTITAPGSKVWDFDYNALGQPVDYDHPNGMTTAYSYDTLNRLAMIDHKDGSTTKQSFEYTLTDGGNIERVEHEDGVYWDYEYDGRNRLTKAERFTTPDIVATYEYTYDDGDNMTYRVQPFLDEFNDANYTGWGTFGTWSAANGYMRSTVDATWRSFYIANTDADLEMTYDYANFDTSSNSHYGLVDFRRVDGNNFVRVYMYPDKMELVQRDGGVTTTLDTNSSATTTEDTWYTVRVVADGADIEVYRAEPGEMEELVLSTASATEQSTAVFYLGMAIPADIGWDNIRATTDDLETTSTFTYNNANELTAMTMTPGGTFNFTYDAWGRMTQKALGSFTADYAYRYGSMLYNVDSDFVGEGEVTYEYGGNAKPRVQTVNSDIRKHRFAWGWNRLNEEDANGDLLESVVFHSPNSPVSRYHAYVEGLNPATGTASYNMRDHIGSTRGMFAANGSVVGRYDYSPFGSPLQISGVALGKLPGAYTGQPWNAVSRTYQFPYRHYSGTFTRWLSPDPLMPHPTKRYTYVRCNPLYYYDPFGLWEWNWECALGGGLGGLIGGAIGGAIGGGAGGAANTLGPGGLTGALGGGIGGGLGGGLGGFLGGGLGGGTRGACWRWNWRFLRWRSGRLSWRAWRGRSRCLRGR